MRLAEFMMSNVEGILAEWEALARSTAPGAAMDTLALRDHAGEILRAAAADMAGGQSEGEGSSKSQGRGGDGGAAGKVLDGASVEHATRRVASGFVIVEVVAEYRALRATVLRLWHESDPPADDRDLDDVTRFNESIDQSLTAAVAAYTRRVEQSRDTFLAILGHDLRNPLAAVTLSGKLLGAAGLDAEAAGLAAGIVRSAEAMRRMVDDLLDFTRTRLGAGMPINRADAADLAALCREVVDETRAAHPPGLVIRLDVTARDATGWWDPVRVRQVVSNLLANAVQHGAADTPIEVTVAAEEREVTVAVRNRGRTIPADALATIFDPLVRLAPPGSGAARRPGSLGLGLYVVRQVVAAHGGTIDVVSSDAAGTTFTVHLPR